MVQLHLDSSLPHVDHLGVIGHQPFSTDNCSGPLQSTQMIVSFLSYSWLFSHVYVQTSLVLLLVVILGVLLPPLTRLVLEPIDSFLDFSLTLRYPGFLPILVSLLLFILV